MHVDTTGSRFRLHSLAILALLCCAAGRQAMAKGFASSGGGRVVSYEVNPWFVGPQATVVRYCIVVGPGFSPGITGGRSGVEAALEDWRKTFAQVEIQRDPALGELVTTFVELPNCNGSVDLTFKLGVMDDDVRLTTATTPGGYVGFAKSLNYDLNKNWSQGYIWLAPDLGTDSYKGVDRPFWRQNAALKGALIHELGHVFGFQHHMGGVMAEQVPESLADAAVRAERAALDAQSLPTATSQWFVGKQFAAIGKPLCRPIASVTSASELTTVALVFPRTPAEVAPANSQVCIKMNFGLRQAATPSGTIELRDAHGAVIDAAQLQFPSGYSARWDPDWSVMGRYLDAAKKQWRTFEWIRFPVFGGSAAVIVNAAGETLPSRLAQDPFAQVELTVATKEGLGVLGWSPLTDVPALTP